MYLILFVHPKYDRSNLVSPYTVGPRYVRSFYLRICVYAIEKWPFSGTYLLIYCDRWSFYIQIHYTHIFWSLEARRSRMHKKDSQVSSVIWRFWDL